MMSDWHEVEWCRNIYCQNFWVAEVELADKNVYDMKEQGKVVESGRVRSHVKHAGNKSSMWSTRNLCDMSGFTSQWTEEQASLAEKVGGLERDVWNSRLQHTHLDEALEVKADEKLRGCRV